MKIWNEVWDYIKNVHHRDRRSSGRKQCSSYQRKDPSESMEQTIMTGDRIFGFRMAYGINLTSSELMFPRK